MVKTSQTSIYEKIFNKSFPAHDAMEDVKALRKILFDSSLIICDEMLTENTLYVHIKTCRKRHEVP